MVYNILDEIVYNLIMLSSNEEEKIYIKNYKMKNKNEMEEKKKK